MAIQVVGQPAPRGKSKAAHFAEAVTGIAEAGAGAYERHTQARLAQSNISEENKAIKEAYGVDLSGITDPKERMAILSQELKIKGQEKLLKNKTEGIGNVLKQYGVEPPSSTGKALRGEGELEPEPEIGTPGEEPEEKMSWADFPAEEIAKIKMFDHDAGVTIENAKNQELEQRRHEENLKEKRAIRQANENRQERKDERDYHTQFSKPSVEKVSKIQEGLDRKELALDLGRSAIESGQVGAFSKDFLADKFNLPFLRTSQGAQLTLASKEQLFPNLARISAKAQNQYMEQRMSSMVPLVGQSEESNLTVQEILEGEDFLDRAYVNEFNRLKREDNEKYGYERKDIEDRARHNVSVKNKQIMKRTLYRLREIEEQEQGLSKMKEKAGKNVIKGTPLTLAMAKIYKEKFGDKALEVAKKNGYYVPTVEEFRVYRTQPKEYREEV